MALETAMVIGREILSWMPGEEEGFSCNAESGSVYPGAHDLIGELGSAI